MNRAFARSVKPADALLAFICEINRIIVSAASADSSIEGSSGEGKCHYDNRYIDVSGALYNE